MKEESQLIIEKGVLFRVWPKPGIKRVVQYPAARQILKAIVERHNIVLDENDHPRIYFKN